MIACPAYMATPEYSTIVRPRAGSSQLPRSLQPAASEATADRSERAESARRCMSAKLSLFQASGQVLKPQERTRSAHRAACP
jgi:hypothetical protein